MSNPNYPTLQEARQFLMTTAHKIPYKPGVGFDSKLQEYKHKCLAVVEEEKMKRFSMETRVDLKPTPFKRY